MFFQKQESLSDLHRVGSPIFIVLWDEEELMCIALNLATQLGGVGKGRTRGREGTRQKCENYAQKRRQSMRRRGVKTNVAAT